MTLNKRPKKKGLYAAAVIVVLLMAVGAVIAILVPRINAAGDSGLSVKAEIPLIKTNIKTDNDKEYSVQTLFTVEMDTETRRKVNDKLLYKELSEIMEGMDIDRLSAANGIDYINQKATEELNKRLSEYTDTNVYVHDFYIGDRVQLADTKNDINEFLGGVGAKKK